MLCLSRLSKLRYRMNRFIFRKCRYSTSTPGVLQFQVSGKSAKMEISAGKLARFADGCSITKIGETAVMVTAVSDKSKSNSSFFPLVVDYRQKAAAYGRIPMNHLRREMGTTDKEILVSRMIDRAIRPMFPKEYSYETQIVCNLLAVDGENDSEIAAINAASAALCLSDIPWDGPIGAVRVGSANGKILINPTRKELEKSDLNLVVAVTKDKNIVMMEGQGNRLDYAKFFSHIQAAAERAAKIAVKIGELQEMSGKAKRSYQPTFKPKDEHIQQIEKLCSDDLKATFSNPNHDKRSRDNEVQSYRRKIKEQLQNEESQKELLDNLDVYFNLISKKTFRQLILLKKLRCDGRELTQLRPMNFEVNLYPPLHGSSLVQRGQTQVLCTLAFDAPHSALRADPLRLDSEKHFMLHYEFPPYATGEIGRMSGRDRRELGHGALAERGLFPVVPVITSSAIRLTAEVLESNGSSSMASVIGGCLALMDAGVEVKEPVAGVAMGLITGGEQSEILSDQLGIEDYMGDMDFKIAGSRTGVTALQLDTKLSGLSIGIVKRTIDQAKDALATILDKMHETLPEPRRVKKSNHPVTEQLTVPPHKRAKLMSSGGYYIRKIAAETGVTINAIDEQKFSIFAPNPVAMNEARDFIDKHLKDDNHETKLEFGGVYEATIMEVRESGVMVTLYPGMQPALVPNSQLGASKVQHPTAAGLVIGKTIHVKYFGRDPSTGQMRLSRKALFLPSAMGSRGSQPANSKEPSQE